MDTTLRALLGLQELDQEILWLRKQLAGFPEAERRAQETLESAAKELEKLRQQTRDLQKLVDQKNVELRAAEEAVRKLDAQSQSLKTNAEYSAMQKQIAAKRAEIGELEDRVLDAMQLVESARTAFPGREQSYKEQERKVAELKAKIAAERTERENRITALKEEWARRSATIPPDSLALYRFLSDRHGGQALAQLSIDGICQGCYMSITANRHSQAMAGNLVQCTSCERLLWMP